MSDLDPRQEAFLRERFDAAASNQPRWVELRDLLLDLDGIEVVAQPEPDLEDLLRYGREWPGEWSILEPGRPISCHENVADLYEDGAIDAIGTGYALSDDGLWRQHSWGFRSATLIETTEPRELYFGIRLDGDYAESFVSWNPLDPEAWSAERDPCALVRPMSPCPDDREGVHFATSWGLAARYAMFKAARSESIGIVLTYDLAGLTLEPDHDATIEKAYGDYQVGDVSYYIEEFDILADPEDPDYDRLADLMEREAEHDDKHQQEEGVYTFEGQLIANAKGSIFMLLADKLRGSYEDAEMALKAISDANIPKPWWAEVIGQVRTFSVVGDDRLLRVQALKPVQADIATGNEPDEAFDEAVCPALLTIEDLDFNLGNVLEQMAVTLWERPGADLVEPHYHGTDLTRARSILEAPEPASALKNPWDPCIQE